MWNFQSFRFFFSFLSQWCHWCGKTDIEIHCTERRFVWGPENLGFVGLCVHFWIFFSRKITSWGLIDDGCLSSYQGRLLSASFFFIPLPGDGWCSVLGFVPADSISNSSTLSLKMQATWDVCYAGQCVCPVFSFNPSCPRQNNNRSLQRQMLNTAIHQLGFPLQVSFFPHVIFPHQDFSRTTDTKCQRDLMHSYKSRKVQERKLYNKSTGKVYIYSESTGNYKRNKYRKVSYTIKVQESIPYNKLYNKSTGNYRIKVQESKLYNKSTGKETTLTLQDWVPVKDGAAHEHHAIARHGGWWGIVNVVHFEDDLAVGCHGDAVTVGQGQGLVVVQHGVQVLNPDSVHRAIKHQPDVLTLKKWLEKVTVCHVICYSCRISKM